MSEWPTDARPTDRAAAVAARAVADRLRAVRRHLRRAVRGPGEPEPVHQLRVWARRAEAALAVYADLLPRRHRAWLGRWLRRLRRAAGRIRDVDVFAARPGGRRSARLRAERARAQRKLARLYRRLGRGRKLKRRAGKVVARLHARAAADAEPFAERARAALRPVAAAFFAALPPAPAEAPALHRFRIRGKELRYAMELLAPALPPAVRDDLYPTVGELQERLGRINDLAGARDRLSRPARRARAEAGLAQARDEFRRWWTPEAHQALRRRFGDLLGSAGASGGVSRRRTRPGGPLHPAGAGR